MGVRQEGVLIVRMMPLPNAYRDIDNASYYPALLEQAGGAARRPLGGVRARVSAPDPSRRPGNRLRSSATPTGDARAIMEVTSPGFFETVGIPLLSGRLTSWSDNEKTLQVAVVSERLARALAPDGDVLGRRVRFGSEQRHQDVVIVGVVRHATLGNPRQPDLPVFYRPALQAAACGELSEPRHRDRRRRPGSGGRRAGRC